MYKTMAIYNTRSNIYRAESLLSVDISQTRHGTINDVKKQ